MTAVIQPNFGKGEISPALYGRVDSDAYKEGLARARNAIVHGYGAVSNRAGTKFVGPVKDHTTTPRLIPFQYSTTNAYVLEFGDLYMRVIHNDAYVTETTVSITGITNANPGVVTATSHGYSNGDQVYISGVLGTLEVNGRWFTVANVTANTFELTDQVTGSNVDTTSWGTYVSGGSVGRIYEVTTVWAIGDVFELKFTQNASILTVVHPNYVVQEITRTGHASWTIAEPAFLPDQDYPTGVTVTANVTGTTTYSYVVTAISVDAEESLTGLDNASTTITGATQADPVVITSAAHGYANGDVVEINSVTGMVEINARRFVVTNQTANTYELYDLEGSTVDGTAYTAYSSGGTANLVQTTITNGATTADNTISWTAAAGAFKYAVYKETNGIFGLIGETQDATFDDKDITPDTTFQPPSYLEIFFFSGELPGAVGYYQQRRVFGGATNLPDQLDYSRAGLPDNFTYRVPRVSDDAIRHTLTSRQVNEIRHILPLDDLLVFTTGSEWAIDSGFDTGFTVSTLRQREQSTWGSSHRQPIVVGGVVFFVQSDNSTVRTLQFDGDKDQWNGEDAGLLSEHMLRENTIVDWAYSKFPDPIIYMVRNDGHMLTMTFNLENKVIGWCDWDTDGKYEAVASLRADSTATQETIYTVVKRTINGNTVRYVEASASREFVDVRDCYFVDSGLSFDNPITISGVSLADPGVVTATAHGLTAGDEVDILDIVWEPTVDTFKNATQPDQLNKRRYFITDVTTNTFTLIKNTDGKAITGATQANPCVITALSHGYVNGDVVGILNVAGMTELNGKTYTVANATTDTFELSGIDSTAYTAYTSGGRVYEAIDTSAYNAYVEDGHVHDVATKLYGLWHLIGESVDLLADGNVISAQTVASDGTLTLTNGASHVHVGLPYVSDVTTLPMETGDAKNRQTTVFDKKKKISEVTVKFSRSRGLLVGPDPTRLTEMKQREFEPYGEPTALLTGAKKIPIPSEWSDDGQIYIRQIYPLPMTILAVVSEVEVGD